MLSYRCDVLTLVQHALPLVLFHLQNGNVVYAWHAKRYDVAPQGGALRNGWNAICQINRRTKPPASGEEAILETERKTADVQSRIGNRPDAGGDHVGVVVNDGRPWKCMVSPDDRNPCGAAGRLWMGGGTSPEQSRAGSVVVEPEP